VTDVVNALLLAIDRPTRGIGALNVGTGRSVTIRYLAAAVAAAADVTPSIVHGPNRAGDVRHSACDPSRCRRSLDFVASTSLEDGLRRTARTLFAPTHGQRA
jgi:Nucleoside-diphosphate-sugar epimerases